jgi:hypothetical protein
MTSMDAATFDVEHGLIQLPGTPTQWIWAFTCPTPKCGCRTAVVISAPGERAVLLKRGSPVAAAWLAHADYGQAAQSVQDVVAFAVDLDTLKLFPSVTNAPFNLVAKPEALEVVARLDDDVLDAIARLWHRGKGESPPPETHADGVKIEVDDWRPGGRLAWDDVHALLRNDTYVFGERIFEAVELYCVKPACDCREVKVDFDVVVPRGAPYPGYVQFHGEVVTLRPKHERQRERLVALWAAYCDRHPGHQARLARRSAIMHGFASRIVAAPT